MCWFVGDWRSWTRTWRWQLRSWSWDNGTATITPPPPAASSLQKSILPDMEISLLQFLMMTTINPQFLLFHLYHCLHQTNQRSSSMPYVKANTNLLQSSLLLPCCFPFPPPSPNWHEALQTGLGVSNLYNNSLSMAEKAPSLNKNTVVVHSVRSRGKTIYLTAIYF